MASMLAILSGCMSIGKHTYDETCPNGRETDVNYHFDLFDLPHREPSCYKPVPAPVYHAMNTEMPMQYRQAVSYSPVRDPQNPDNLPTGKKRLYLKGGRYYTPELVDGEWVWQLYDGPLPVSASM